MIENNNKLLFKKLSHSLTKEITITYQFISYCQTSQRSLCSFFIWPHFVKMLKIKCCSFDATGRLHFFDHFLRKDLREYCSTLTMLFLWGTLFRPRNSIGTSYVSSYVNKNKVIFRFSNNIVGISSLRIWDLVSSCTQFWITSAKISHWKIRCSFC
jgi:hypothetical protein